ncbi:MAG: hypothetical protein V3W31_08955 [Thermodesulfobacteriota bacterium]
MVEGETPDVGAAPVEPWAAIVVQSEEEGEDDEESWIEEILTPEKNRTPSQTEYVKNIERTQSEVEEENTLLGRTASPSDIKITVTLQTPATADISYRLLKKPHPMARGKGGGKRKKEVLLEESGGGRDRRIFSFAIADKAGYNFVVENSGQEALSIGLTFLLYEGKTKEKTRKIEAVEVGPGEAVEFKFILPEAVFWDDDDYFSGLVEGPRSVTKFNEDTGLVWEEEKDR